MHDTNFWPATLVDWAQVASAIGTILGAIATTAAIIITLRLARRDFQEQLIGYIGYSYAFAKPPIQNLNLELTNRGTRPATVATIHLEYPSGQRNRWGQHILPAMMFYPRWGEAPSEPFTFGQTKQFACSLGPVPLKHVHTIQDARLLRMIVETTTGTTIKISPKKEIAKYILQAAEEYRTQSIDKEDASEQQP